MAEDSLPADPNPIMALQQPLRIDLKEHNSQEKLREILKFTAKNLQNGAVVAVPTDTIYGYKYIFSLFVINLIFCLKEGKIFRHCQCRFACRSIIQSERASVQQTYRALCFRDRRYLQVN